MLMPRDRLSASSSSKPHATTKLLHQAVHDLACTPSCQSSGRGPGSITDACHPLPESWPGTWQSDFFRRASDISWVGFKVDGLVDQWLAAARETAMVYSALHKACFAQQPVDHRR